MACIALDICFIQILRQFQQYFSHIARVSGCGRERSVHFESAASPKYYTPDIWHDIQPSLIIMTQG